MGKLIYAAVVSLDGYYEDADGGFGWAEPDEEVHAFFNALDRPVGTHLYGRRMYETMVFWETAPTEGEPEVFREYAEIWRSADKVVFSRTLDAPTSARTRIEPTFDPTAVRALKEAAPTDLSIGGGELAGQALAAGLVDEVHLLVHPVLVGGGKPALRAQHRVDLALLDQRRFAGGVVHLHYAVTPKRDLA